MAIPPREKGRVSAVIVLRIQVRTAIDQNLDVACVAAGVLYDLYCAYTGVAERERCDEDSGCGEAAGALIGGSEDPVLLQLAEISRQVVEIA